MAMQIRRYDAECIVQYSRSRATLDALDAAIAIGQVFTPYHPGGHHGHRFWRKKNRVVALWKSLSEASIQKAQNRPSTQLIKTTSCVERSNATMKAEELS